MEKLEHLQLGCIKHKCGGVQHEQQSDAFVGMNTVVVVIKHLHVGFVAYYV